MTGLVFKQMNEGIRGERLCPRPHSLEQSPGSCNSELTLTSQHTGGSGGCTFALSATWQPGKVFRQKGKGVLGSLGWAGKETGWGSGGLGAVGPGGQLLDAGRSASCLSGHRLLSFAASSSRLQGLAFSENRCGLAQGGDSRATSPLTLIHFPREKGTHSLPQTSGHRHLTRNCPSGLPTAPLLRLKRQQPQPLLLKKDPHGHPYLSSSSTPQPALPHVAQTNQLLLAPPAHQDHCSPRGLLHGPRSSLFQPKRTVCAPASSTVTHGCS